MTQLHAELHDAFASYGDKIAVAGPRGKDVTYREFGALIASAQELIQSHKPKAVGILATRSLGAYIGVMGAFFSGVRFVPLNPELPTARLATIVEQGQVELVLYDCRQDDIGAITTGLCRDIATLDPCDAAPRIGPAIQSSDIAYQMFTSGSTGAPKGVPITYSNLAHYVTSIRAATGDMTGGRFSQLFDLSFDLAMHDIFVALVSGGTIVPASMMDMMMPHAYIEKKKITQWFSVPLVASVALRGLGDKTPEHKLDKAMFCGEQLPMDYAQGFRCFVKQGGDIYNLYGPTEATIAFTAKRVDPDMVHPSVVPLGTAFGENYIGIETESGDIIDVAEGAEGELLLAGPQVFEGYLPKLNAECFTGEAGRYYRSGDLVRMRDGELHHLGRKDSQIKLRGYRIELGDIEAAFRKAYGCTSAAAVVLGTQEAREIGLAYQAEQTIEDLGPLSDVLPPYMMPARLMRLDQMPTNINGKIDRKSLVQMSWPT